MAQITIERNYTCDLECEETGCPGHIAKLHFNSTAVVYKFEDGQGHSIALDYSSAQILLEMFKQLSDKRADSVKFK